MPLLTLRAAARELGVAYSTLKRWVGAGVVRTTRTPGGHHRIADAEVARLAARQGSADEPGRRPVADPEAIGALSARNRLAGFVEEVRVDGLLAQVRLRVGDQTITAVITADAVRALKMRRGDEAIAIVKSTEVMVARPAVAAPRTGRRKTGSRRRS